MVESGDDAGLVPLVVDQQRKQDSTIVTTRATTRATPRVSSVDTDRADRKIRADLLGQFLQSHGELQERVVGSGSAALQPLAVGAPSPRAPFIGAVDVRVDLSRPACDAHEPPVGRLGHRLAPALGEPLGSN